MERMAAEVINGGPLAVADGIYLYGNLHRNFCIEGRRASDVSTDGVVAKEMLSSFYPRNKMKTEKRFAKIFHQLAFAVSNGGQNPNEQYRRSRTQSALGNLSKLNIKW